MTLDRRALVATAMLAPSVHNVQPARWRLMGDDGLALFEDQAVRLSVGDPTGHDAAISLGAATEGLRLAAAAQGAAFIPSHDVPEPDGTLIPIAAYRLIPGQGQPDPLSNFVEARRSWRGSFLPPSKEDRRDAGALNAEDLAVIADPDKLRDLARLADRASFGFMERNAFRQELLSWMRLSPRHPRWNNDGLNARAMGMGRFEAWGAGLVLGRLFRLLHRMRLAAPLLSEASKTARAAALIVFHRPADEAPFVSGAHFYRCWLRLEAAGFGASVIAALADDQPSAEQVARLADLPPGRRVVSTFRIGRRPEGAIVPRARRPFEEVLV